MCPKRARRQSARGLRKTKRNSGSRAWLANCPPSGKVTAKDVGTRSPNDESFVSMRDRMAVFSRNPAFGCHSRRDCSVKIAPSTHSRSPSPVHPKVDVVVPGELATGETLADALARNPDHDVVIADVRVALAEDLLARLAACALAEPSTATVSVLS